MRIYDTAFYVCGFFLIGVLFYSLKLSLSLIIFVVAFAAILFLLIGYLEKNKSLFWLAGFAPLVIFGAVFASSYDAYQIERANIIFNKRINFSGVVIDYPERGDTQRLVVALERPYAGRILVTLPAYPEFDYGDLIDFEGAIKSPKPESYADYLKKERIFGVVSSPKAELISRGHGSNLKAQLFELKEGIISNFQRILSQEKAAFLAGITLGERAEFSKELKEAMKRSGTTHLVALSGYNISIIAWTVASLLGSFLSRRWSFILSIFVIIGFVLMTGAEASVVRAAIMGTILLVAKQVGRVYSLRNAIIIAAFLMVLANPRVLRFDVGFQLSFLALFGIAYLAPAIQRFFKFDRSLELSSLKGIFLETLSAQLAVAPLLILYFGNFSLVALLTNVLILSLIPLTMALGFIIGAVGFISFSISFVLGWFLNPLLIYELFVIKLFGSFTIFNIDSISIAFTIIYYIMLGAFVVFFNIQQRPAAKKI